MHNFLYRKPKKKRWKDSKAGDCIKASGIKEGFFLCPKETRNNSTQKNQRYMCWLQTLFRPYESRAKFPMARAAASWVSTSLYVRHLPHQSRQRSGINSRKFWKTPDLHTVIYLDWHASVNLTSNHHTNSLPMRQSAGAPCLTNSGIAFISSSIGRPSSSKAALERACFPKNNMVILYHTKRNKTSKGEPSTQSANWHIKHINATTSMRPLQRMSLNTAKDQCVCMRHM